ncbi:MAG: hypothetical protein U0Q22_14675 [Acidimicrobiales bacterium]
MPRSASRRVRETAREKPRETARRALGRFTNWTPDFDAGVAELEVESTLAKFQLLHRCSLIASGVLQVLARPEEVVRPALAWGTLSLDGANAAFVWWRSRRWRSLLSPEIAAVDRLAGLASVTLGTRAVSTASQAEGFAWTNRSLVGRSTAAPFTSTAARDRAAAFALLLLPHVAWPPGGRCRDGRTVLRHVAPGLVMGTAQSFFTSNAFRRRGKVIDERAAVVAGSGVEQALRNETLQFVAEVLRPTLDTLASARHDLRDQPDRAVALAGAEEIRIRAWLRASSAVLEAPVQVDMTDDIVVSDRTNERIIRLIEGNARLLTSALALFALRRRGGGNTIAAATLAVRGIVGSTIMSDTITARIGLQRIQPLLSATDVAAVAATGWHQMSSPLDRRIAGWAEEFVYGVAATTGTARNDASARLSSAFISGNRVIVAMSAPRPLGRRLAAAADELLLVNCTACLLRGIVDAAFEQNRLLTESSTSLAAQEHRDLLRDLRIGRHALLHDGPAQVLGALAGGGFDPVVMTRWLDREIARLDEAIEWIEQAMPPEQPPLADAIADLADEFGARGVVVHSSVPTVPDWVDEHGRAVTGIVREALNNVQKHARGREAWIALDPSDDIAVVTIADSPSRRRGATAPTRPRATAQRRPGSGGGTGTRTMAALARQAGGDIAWRPLPGGGTEVRLTVRRTTS